MKLFLSALCLLVLLTCAGRPELDPEPTASTPLPEYAELVELYEEFQGFRAEEMFQRYGFTANSLYADWLQRVRKLEEQPDLAAPARLLAGLAVAWRRSGEGSEVTSRFLSRFEQALQTKPAEQAQQTLLAKHDTTTNFTGQAGGGMAVSIVFSGDTQGVLAPQKVTKGLAGGIARRTSFINDVRSGHPNLFVLDAGDALATGFAGADRTNRKLLHAMNTMGYDAVGLNSRDLEIGQAQLRELAELASFPLICSNLEFQGQAWPWIEPYVVLERAGIRMAVLSLAADAGKTVLPGVRITPAREALDRLLPKVRAAADFVVLLTQLGRAELEASLAGLDGIDVVLGDRMESVDGRGWYLPSVSKGMGVGVGVVRLQRQQSGAVSPASWASIELTDDTSTEHAMKILGEGGLAVALRPSEKSSDVAEGFTIAHQSQPVEQVQQPQPVEQAQEPQPVEQVQQPQPVEQAQEPQPVEQVQETKTAEQVQQPQPVEQAQETQPVEQAQEMQPVEQAQQPQPVEQAQETQSAEQAQEPQPVEQVQETQTAEQAQETKPAEQAQQPQPVEQAQETQPVEQVQETKTAEQAQKTQSAEQDTAVSATGPTRSRGEAVSIVFSGDTQGVLAPQKGTKGVAGGVARRTAFINTVRSGHPDLFVLDSGDALATGFAGADRNNRKLVHAMNAMGYDAVGLNSRDLEIGQARLRELAELASFPLICSNLEFQGQAWPWIEPYVVLERAGNRMAVFSLAADAGKTVLPGVRIVPAREAMNRLLPEAQATADFVVLLTQLGRAELEASLAGLDGIDVVLGDRMESADGRGWYLPSVSKGMGVGLGVVRLQRQQSGAVSPASWALIELTRRPSTEQALKILGEGGLRK